MGEEITNNQRNETYLLGIDIGAGSCRAIIFDAQFNVIGEEQRKYSRSNPRPGWVELNPKQWWNDVANTIKIAINNSDISSNHIKCLGITAETDGIMPVDEDGEPLRPYIHWSDARCLPQHEWIQKNANIDNIYTITGIPLHKGWWSPPALKMAWIRENEPKIFEKTSKFLQIGNYILYKLTGKYMTDYSTASRTLLFDIKRMEWSKKISELLNIPMSTQPELHNSIDVISEITSEAAGETGLHSNTMLVTGGGDTECSALGAGVISEGQTLISIGTSLMVAIPRKEPSFITKGSARDLFGTGFVCTSHVIPNMWILEVGCLGGAILRWFTEEFGQLETQISDNLGISPYQILNVEADRSNPNPNSPISVLPIGAIFNLSIEHKRGDLIRSILEGVAYEAQEVIEIAEESGITIKDLTLVGGGAKSKVWRQIITDVVNKPAKTHHLVETATLGAAMLASVGIGIYKDFTEIPVMSGHKHNTPRKEFHNIYKLLYNKYKSYHTLKF